MFKINFLPNTDPRKKKIIDKQRYLWHVINLMSSFNMHTVNPFKIISIWLLIIIYIESCFLRVFHEHYPQVIKNKWKVPLVKIWKMWRTFLYQGLQSGCQKDKPSFKCVLFPFCFHLVWLACYIPWLSLLVLFCWVWTVLREDNEPLATSFTICSSCPFTVPYHCPSPQ